VRGGTQEIKKKRNREEKQQSRSLKGSFVALAGRIKKKLDVKMSKLMLLRKKTKGSQKDLDEGKL